MKITLSRRLQQRNRMSHWFQVSCSVLAIWGTLAVSAKAQNFAPSYDLGHLPGSAPDAPQVLAYGGAASDALGRTVRTGDVNGDGLQDIIAGATGADVGLPLRNDAGAVYVWFGKPSLAGVKDAAGVLGTAPDVTIWGASAADQLSAAGALVVKDINGDGIPDLLMGAALADGPGNGRNNCGEAYIVFGRATFPALLDLAIQGPGGADVTVYGASNDDNLSSSGTLAVADFNGDGRPDVLLGAPLADGPAETRNSCGEACVVFGRAAFPVTLDLALQSSSGADVTIYAANASDFLTLGGSLSTGDVNGDGIADVILGAQGGDGPSESRSSAGEAYVVAGRHSFPATLDLGIQGPGGADLTAWGATANDLMASSGSLAARDLDGDGIADLILGASGGDGPAEARSGAGETYVIRGRTALPFTLDMAVAGAGGADLTIYGATAGDSLTSGGTFAFGDVNGDGVNDLLLGAPLADGPLESRNSAGEAYVVFGGGITAPVRDLAVQGSSGADVTIYGATAADNLCIGRTLTVADVNGNGIGDIVLGATLADGPLDQRLNAGEAYIVRGRSALPATLDLSLSGNAGANVTFYGATAADQLTAGGALAAGDLNGDGLLDVIIGVSNGDGPGETRGGSGELSVLYGVGVPQIAVSQPAANNLPDGGGKSFGTLAVGVTKKLVFSIKNVGAVNLAIGGLSIDGIGSSLFAVTGGPAGNVAPGAVTTFTVTFSPDSIGLHQAFLHIVSNDEEQSPFDIELSGLAVIPIPPVVTTLDAQLTGTVSAMLNATVNAVGSEREVFFEYGTTAGYGTTVAAQPALVDGIDATPVQVALEGLLPRTLYHFRVTAAGDLGSAVGQDQTFTTPNQIPISAPDFLAIQPGTTAVLDVLANDTDGDGDILEVVSFNHSPEKKGPTLALIGGHLVFSAPRSFTGATFSYTVADGYGGSASATVTVSPLVCAITPASASISAAGGTYPVTVSANGSWIAEVKHPWILVTPESGVGDGTVSITVLPNKSKGSRSQTILIGGQSHTLTQTGARWPAGSSLPVALATTFHGLIAPHSLMNGNLGSRLNLTTTTSGAFTGKVTTANSSQSVVGLFAANEELGVWQAAIPISGPAQQALTLSVALDPDNNSLEGTLADSAANSVPATGWRTAANPSVFAASYAFTLHQPNPDPALPQGNGTGTFGVEALTGAVLLAGRLSDGSDFTGSTFVGTEGQVLIYQPLYSNRGSFAGALTVTPAPSVADNTIAGALSWFAPAITTGPAKKPATRPGFGPIPVSATGGVTP